MTSEDGDIWKRLRSEFVWPVLAEDPGSREGFSRRDGNTSLIGRGRAAEAHRDIRKYQDIVLSRSVPSAKNGPERTLLLSAREYSQLKRRVLAARDLTIGRQLSRVLA